MKEDLITSTAKSSSSSSYLFVQIKIHDANKEQMIKPEQDSKVELLLLPLNRKRRKKHKKKSGKKMNGFVPGMVATHPKMNEQSTGNSMPYGLQLMIMMINSCTEPGSSF